MQKIAALTSLPLLLMACGWGIWVVVRPSPALFVVPAATQLHITELGWRTWQITYHAPGTPTTWYGDVARQLEANDWSSQDHRAYGALSSSYIHTLSFGIGELWQRAYLTFDPLQPQIAHINVRHDIVIPWLRRLLEYQPA
jgi:hypothetical protein